MILDSTLRKIEVLLGGTVSANQLPVTADWVDITSTTTTGGATTASTNNTTAVTAVAAPAASTQRKVNGISIYNADTANATVTVQYNDNGTTYLILKITLSIGYTLHFTDVEGWFVTDTNGNRQTAATTVFNVATTIAGVNDQTGTTYTLGLSDAGKNVRINNASAITLTVPPNASVAFPVGTFVFFERKGAGDISASAGSGVTLRTPNGSATTAQYDIRGLIKTDTDEWVML